jgi:thiosulfate dehydrogenase (quinone) large subunit
MSSGILKRYESPSFCDLVSGQRLRGLGPRFRKRRAGASLLWSLQSGVDGCMKNQSTDQPGFDVALAHCFARVALGLCIALHGYSRLPNLVGFANGMVKQFAATFLPSPLVYVTGFGIAIGEAIIGTLLIFGIFLRPTLVVGTLLMLQLIFGTTLIQQWEIVSIQLIYVAFYVGLLATVRHDRFSIDGLRRRGRGH